MVDDNTTADVAGEVAADGVAHFVTPSLYDNPNGWGPSDTPDMFKDVPYAPFSKSDRLGRAADWTAQGQYQRGRGQYQSQGVNSAFNYYHVDDDSEFQAVEKKARNFNKFRRPFQNRQYQRNGPARGRRGQQWDQVKPGKQQQQPQHNKRRLRWASRRWGRWRRNNVQRELEASLEVQPEWKSVDELELAALAKMSTDDVPTGEDVVTCGEVEYYDQTYDRVSTKNERILERIERVHHYVTTSEDPVIQNLATEGQGNIFATDALISMIMACPRSVYSWDIVVERVGNKLFFDKRVNSTFDYITVNETCPDIGNDDDDDKTKDPNNINSIPTLSREATFINQNFSQQVLDRADGSEKFAFEQPNPFSEDLKEDIASVGYLYRKWDLGDGNVLVGRCEVTGVKRPKAGEVQDRPNFMLVKALNEYDPKITGVDWRQKLDSQRGAVLATELRNNSCKLTRWTAQAVLAGAESMYLGYVSRVHFKDNFQHVILGTQLYKPEEFARQINLKLKNMWAIFKHLASYFLKKPEGKYLLFREPNRNWLRVYQVPTHAFDPEDDDDDEELM